MDENLIEIPVEKTTIYDGRIFTAQVWSVRLPNGATAPRELVIHKGAAAIVALNQQGEIAMVRQYRAAMERVLWEIPAGKLDSAGEDPLECAHRELQEETGLTADSMELLTKLEAAPGYSSEIIHIYLAQGLHQRQAALDEDEFLEVRWLPLQEVRQRILAGEIGDSKTIAGVLLAWERGRREPSATSF